MFVHPPLLDEDDAAPLALEVPPARLEELVLALLLLAPPTPMPLEELALELPLGVLDVIAAPPPLDVELVPSLAPRRV